MVDENPRKKLWRTLREGSDKDLAQSVGKYSAKRFDELLSTNPDFQNDFFLDLKDRGMADDPAEFAKLYLQPADPPPTKVFLPTPREQPEQPSPSMDALDPKLTQHAPSPTPGLIQKGWEAVKGLFGGEPEPAQNLVQPYQFESDAQKDQSALSPVFQDHEAAKLPAIFQTKEAQRRTGLTPEQKQQAIEGSSGAPLTEQRRREALGIGGRAMEDVGSFASGANRAILKTPSGILKTAVELSTGIPNMMGAGLNPEDALPYQIADVYDKWLDESEFAKNYIADPNRTGMANDLGAGIGQIASMIAAGGGSAAAMGSRGGVMKEVANKFLTPASGVAFSQVFSSEYENQIKKGESPEVAFRQALANGLVAMPLESIPLINLAERMKAVNPTLTRKVMNTLAQGIDEGSQETIQQIFSNLTNNQLVELDSSLQDWSEGVAQSGEVGGIIGLMMGALAGAKHRKGPPKKLGGIPTVPAPPTDPAFTNDTDGSLDNSQQPTLDPTGDGVVAPVVEEVEPDGNTGETTPIANESGEGRESPEQEGVTEQSVKERLGINHPFYQKISDALDKLGLIKKYNPETGEGDVVGGYVQSDGHGGFASGGMNFKADGSISYVTSDGIVVFNENGDVISENTQEVKSERQKQEIQGKKDSIKSLKERRDSEDFKYKTVKERDPNNPLATRQVKRLKTEQELKESTDKINEVIAKTEAELATIAPNETPPTSPPLPNQPAPPSLAVDREPLPAPAPVEVGTDVLPTVGEETASVEPTGEAGAQKPIVAGTAGTPIQIKATTTPNVILRTGTIPHGEPAFFSIPSEGGVFNDDNLKKLGSDPNTSAYTFPPDFKIKDMTKTVFDDYKAKGMDKKAKKEGFDAVRVMELDGTIVMDVLNPSKLRRLDPSLPDVRQSPPPTKKKKSRPKKESAFTVKERKQMRDAPVYSAAGMVRKWLLNGGKLEQTSITKELTGTNKNDKNSSDVTQGLFGSVSKDGLTVNQLAHQLWENQENEDQFTDQDFREAIIEVANEGRGGWYANHYRETQEQSYEDEMEARNIADNEFYDDLSDQEKEDALDEVDEVVSDLTDEEADRLVKMLEKEYGADTKTLLEDLGRLDRTSFDPLNLALDDFPDQKKESIRQKVNDYINGKSKEQTTGTTDSPTVKQSQASLKSEVARLENKVATQTKQLEKLGSVGQSDIFGGVAGSDLVIPTDLKRAREVLAETKAELAKAQAELSKMLIGPKDQVPKGQMEIGEPAPKETKRKIRDEKAQEEVDAASAKFMAFFKNTNSGIDPAHLAAGLEMMAAYTKQGIYKLSDIVEDLHAKYGDAAKRAIDALKDVYGAFAYRAPKDIRGEFNTPDEVEAYQFEIKKDNGNDQKPTTDNTAKPNVGKNTGGPKFITTSENLVPAFPSRIANGLDKALTDYQKVGANAILNAIATGKKAFILADGPGAGKTRQIIASAYTYAQKNPTKRVVIITENVTIIAGSFKSDAQSMGVPFNIDGKGRAKMGTNIDIATYHDFRGGLADNADVVFIDEAQNASGLDSKTSEALARFKGFVTYATATPFDTPEKMLYILPRALGISQNEFLQDIGAKIVERPRRGKELVFDEGAIDYLGETLGGYHVKLTEGGQLLQREYEFYGNNKGEIVLDGTEGDDLSKKENGETISMSLSDAEDGISNFYERKISAAKNFGVTDAEARQGLTKEEKIRQLRERRNNEMAKLNETYKATTAFVGMIKQDLADGKQVLIYADKISDALQFHFAEEMPESGGDAEEDFSDAYEAENNTYTYSRPSFYDTITKRLKSAGIDFVTITGETDDKAGSVSSFQGGKPKVVILNKSGTTGINLNDAIGDAPRKLYVVGALENSIQKKQLEGRISRMNNKSKAEVVYVRTSGTAENKQQRGLDAKDAVMNAFIKGEFDKPETPKGEKQVKAIQQQVTESKEDVDIIDYSEKAILVKLPKGDQRHDLIGGKGLGGKWNKYKLGYFFPKTKKAEVEAVLFGGNKEQEVQVVKPATQGQVGRADLESAINWLESEKARKDLAREFIGAQNKWVTIFPDKDPRNFGSQLPKKVLDYLLDNKLAESGPASFDIKIKKGRGFKTERKSATVYKVQFENLNKIKGLLSNFPPIPPTPPPSKNENTETASNSVTRTPVRTGPELTTGNTQGETGNEGDRGKPLTPSQKLAAAHAKWKASHNNLGIIFDPYSNAKSDIEFLGAILEYAKEKAIETYDQFKDILKEYGVWDESKDKEWREVWDGTQPPKTPTTEKSDDDNLVEKTFLGRAYRGSKSEGERSEMERIGLFRKVGNIKEATALGAKLYHDLGVEGAINAIENREEVDGLVAMGIYRALTEDLQTQFENETDPTKVLELWKTITRAKNAGSGLTTYGGQVLRMAKEILEAQVVPYDYTSKIKIMKDFYPEYYERNTPEVEAAFKQAQELMDQAIKDRAKLDQDIANWELQKSIDNVAESVAKEKKSNPTEKRAWASTNKYVKKDRYEKARAEFDDIFKTFSANPGPQLIKPLATMAAYHIEAGARSFAAFSKKMVDELGDKVKPYLEDAYKAGLDELKKAGGKASDEVEVVGENIKVPHSLIRQYVEDGVTDPKDLVRLIHEDLKVEHPEITERQVRDAISNYGKTFERTEIEGKIAEMKDLMRKISQLEDIEKQLRPLKTGLKRDELTNRQRELGKQVREAMKTLPITDEDVQKHLKTALDGIKTRLKNEIADLDRQIEAEKKDAKTKGVEYDEDANLLKAQRDERKRRLDDIVGKPEESIETKIENAIKSLEESTKKFEIQAYRLRRGLPIETNSTSPTLPDTPELKAAKDARDKAKKERDELLKGTPKLPEQIKLEALQKKLDDILQGEFKDQKDRVEDSPEVKALKEQIIQAKHEAGLIAAKRTKDEIAIEKAENDIKELDRRIDELDFSQKEKGETVESDELKAVKRIKAEKTKKLSDLKNELHPPKTPEEKRLERLQKDLDNLLQGKIPETKDKAEDSPAVKAIKEQIARQKELLGLRAAKLTPSEVSDRAALLAKERRLADLEKEVADLVKGQETERTKKEPRRSDKISELDALIKANKETLKALRDEKGITAREELKAWRKAAQAQTDKWNKKRAKGDFTTKPRKPPREFSAEDERIENDKFRAKELYDEEFRKAEEAQKGWQNKVANYAYDIFFNLSRGIVLGIDLGILGIQAAELSARNPKLALQAFKDGARALISEEEYLKQSARRKENPDYRVMRKSKLALVSPHAHEGDVNKEEAALGQLTEKIWDQAWASLSTELEPVIPYKTARSIERLGQKVNPISALNRAQAAYMNTLRAGTLLEGMALLKSRGITYQNNPEAYHQFADAVNTLSGRASLAGIEAAPTAYKALTAVFLSPRNWASILKTATPYAFAHFGRMNAGRAKFNPKKPSTFLSPAQRLYAEAMVARVGFTLGTIILTKLLSGWNDDEDKEKKDKITVNLDDPTASDYMTIRLNNQMFDPWGGKRTQIVLQARLAAAALDMDRQYTNIHTREKSKLGEGDAPFAWELIGDNAYNKLNLWPQYGIKRFLNSSPVEGEEDLRVDGDGFKFRPSDELRNLYTPMTFPTAKETWGHQHGLVLPFALAQGFIGVGVTTLDKDMVQSTPTRPTRPKRPMSKIRRGILP